MRFGKHYDFFLENLGGPPSYIIYKKKFPLKRTHDSLKEPMI